LSQPKGLSSQAAEMSSKEDELLLLETLIIEHEWLRRLYEQAGRVNSIRDRMYKGVNSVED
jgi:hypothetical protein